MWITDNGVATAAGFVMNEDLYLLPKIAEHSFCKNRMDRNFINNLAKKMDIGMQVLICLFGSIGTLITLL